MSDRKGSMKVDKSNGPYHVAKHGGREAWAYNESPASVEIYVHDPQRQLTLKIKVRKSVLRNLAALK